MYRATQWCLDFFSNRSKILKSGVIVGATYKWMGNFGLKKVAFKPYFFLDVILLKWNSTYWNFVSYSYSRFTKIIYFNPIFHIFDNKNFWFGAQRYTYILFVVIKSQIKVKSACVQIMFLCRQR